MNRYVPIAAFIFAVAAGGCDKKSTEPVSSSSSVVYAITDPYPDGMIRIFCIDTGIDSVVDSIVQPGLRGPALGVSPDGAELYLHNAVIDTKTKRKIPGALSGVPTPDGERLIYSRAAPDTLRVICRATNTVLYENDTVPLTGLYAHGGDNFDALRGLVYGALYDSARHFAPTIGVFDYRNLEFVREIVPADIGGLETRVANIALTSDGNLLMYSGSWDSPFFTCIDLVKEKVVGLYHLNGSMSLGITPDDSRVYVTDPGGYMAGRTSRLVQIYAPTQGEFKTPIDLNGKLNPCDTLGVVQLGLTDCIVILPGGTKAYLSTWDGFALIVLDLSTNSVAKVLCGFGFVNSLAVQRY